MGIFKKASSSNSKYDKIGNDVFKFSKKMKSNSMFKSISKIKPILNGDNVIVAKLNYTFDKKTTEGLIDILKNNITYNGMPLDFKLLYIENIGACIGITKLVDKTVY
jgi:hypothetical protein